MRVLLFAPVLALAGCVFPADIERIEAAHRDWRQDVTREISDLADTQADKDRIIAELTSSQSTLEKETGKVVLELQSRVANVVQMAKEGKDWLEIAMYVGMGVVGGGGGLGVASRLKKKAAPA